MLTADAIANDRSGASALLVFTLDGKRFALRAEVVHRIVRAAAITALPKAPKVVEGVVNVAGTVVPVLDVRYRFALPPAPLLPDQHFIVAQAGRRTVAVRVDHAHELIEVESESVEAATALPGVEYVAGIAKLDDGLIVIHDLERFLALDEAAELDLALATEPR